MAEKITLVAKKITLVAKKITPLLINHPFLLVKTLERESLDYKRKTLAEKLGFVIAVVDCRPDRKVM